MKILIIDRDSMFSSLLAGRMRAAGHDVYETTVKNEGIERLGTERIDCVYFDPSPLTDPKAIVYQIRRQVSSFPYLVLIGNAATHEQALQAGCHAFLTKPLDPKALEESLENAQRMSALIQRMDDQSIDFPSAGGVISKSAFNQLFMSSIDRAGRYGEVTHILFINVANYDDIKIHDGKYPADYAVSRLAQLMARARRQSDILGQTAPNEYALLLQRPQTESESLDAAKRFAALIEEPLDLNAGANADLFIELTLLRMPGGQREFHNVTRIKTAV